MPRGRLARSIKSKRFALESFWIACNACDRMNDWTDTHNTNSGPFEAFKTGPKHRGIACGKLLVAFPSNNAGNMRLSPPESSSIGLKNKGMQVCAPLFAVVVICVLEKFI